MDKFLHSKERSSGSREQPARKPSLVSSSAQEQEQPPPKVETSVVAEGKNIPPAVKPLGAADYTRLNHFNFLAVLGKGNFGKVLLAETRTTKQLLAIKVLKNKLIIKNNKAESTYSKKRVFLIANKDCHLFLYNLHACFQTKSGLYLVIEYINGGDLMSHIQRGQFGTKRTKLYAAEVCLALEYLHKNKVVYCGLKLNNILLTVNGHIKVANFGLCKEDM